MISSSGSVFLVKFLWQQIIIYEHVDSSLRLNDQETETDVFHYNRRKSILLNGFAVRLGTNFATWSLSNTRFVMNHDSQQVSEVILDILEVMLRFLLQLLVQLMSSNTVNNNVFQSNVQGDLVLNSLGPVTKACDE